MTNPVINKLLASGTLISVEDPEPHYLMVGESLNEVLLPINPASHKGHFGHVLVCEGHGNFLGASRLAALAALRAGAGLLTLGVDSLHHGHPHDYFEFMKRPLNDIDQTFLDKISALVVGPGLSKEPRPQKYAQELISKASLVPNIIIDADALSLMALQPLKHLGGQLILTPHSGEAAGLLEINVDEVEADRYTSLRALSQLPINQDRSIIWLIKGPTTLIYQPGMGTIAIPGSTPLLACGGSGDVLAGLIAGLIKQTLSPLAATMLAVHTMIKVGRLNQQWARRGVLASELANHLPHLLLR